jgi:PKD repeat protein
LPSTNKVSKYNIYHNDNKIAEVSAKTLSYYIPSTESKEGVFGITAVYEGGIETEKASTTAPIPHESTNKAINFQTSGVRLPDVFNEKYEEATIEYYIKPNSLKNWNQVVGPGWGTFMMHAESNGAFTAGWNTTANDRFTTGTSILRTGTWTHIAVVIKGNRMTLYANGVEKGSCTSSNYSGIGSFGNLEFRAENDYYNTNNDAQYDEIRIWNVARTANEIKDSYASQISGTLCPKGLIAYYKGDIINVNGKSMLHEYISSKHGEFLNSSYSSETSSQSLNGNTSPSVSINAIKGNVYAGTPVKLSATYNNAVSNLKWTVQDAGITNLAVAEPLVTFKTSGYKTITVVAENSNGNSVTKDMTIYVYPEKEIDASFIASKSDVVMGEKVSFIIKNPSFGEMYEWNITGAEENTVYGQHGYAIFKEPGKQQVTLKVTSLSGNKTATSSIDINVAGSAPVADFEVTPAVVLKGERVYLTDKSKYTPVNWCWTIESDAKQYVITEQNGSFTPKKSGIYNVTLEAGNNIGSNSITRERAITVCNADSRNGLNFSGRSNAKVTATTTGFSGSSNAFTVEWWMRPDNLQSNCLGIGESESTFLVTAEADGRVNIYISGRKIRGYSGYIIANEWHHYAVILENGYVSLYRDGEYFERDYVSYNANIPSLGRFVIGNDNATMNGQIDELRIWKKALNNETLAEVCNEPIENPGEHSDLVLYYDFNQSGGDVIDRTSNGNNGVRSGFGPDGDAWGLSKGVFSLSYGDEATKEDVTSLYLTNYRAEFAHSNNLVNPNVSNRFYELTGWTIENAVVSGNITTGAHVDAQKDYFMTFTSNWDGFGAVKNHKTYQTATLPAGKYKFIAKYYDKWEGQSGNSYLVAAQGTGLPDTENVASAIAYTKMKEYDHATVFSNEVEFILEEETEVSLGLIVNLSYKSCLTIKEFILEWEELENSGEEGGDTAVEDVESTINDGAIYNLQGIEVLKPLKGNIYIKDGKKIVIK